MSIYLNRDVSWLKFNERVLKESERKSHPLLERALFLKIVSSNLKEFSMIRIGSLKQLLSLDVDQIEWRSSKPLKKVLKDLNETINNQRKAIIQSGSDLLEAFKNEGFNLIAMEELNHEDQKALKERFIQEYFMLSHQMKVSLSDFVLSVHSEQNYRMFKTHTDDFYQLEFITEPPYAIELSKNTFVRVDDILRFIYDSDNSTYFTVSFFRNADIDYKEAFEDEEEIPKKLKKLLKSRQTTDLLRLHLKTKDIDEIIPFFKNILTLDNDAYYATTDFESWDMLYKFLNKTFSPKYKTLRFPIHQPVWPLSINSKKSLIKQLLAKDQLWHYPYDSFVAFEMLLYEGAMHEDVKSMAITVYRLAEQSHLVNVLKMARRNGKKVTVVLELRARFDEDNNMHYAAELEAAGCKVLYGPKKIKLHAKLFVMTFKNGESLTQIGSGNYHEVTARLYTDFAYLTTHKGIGEDALKFFRSLETKEKETPAYDHLLVAPEGLKKSLIRLIKNETKKGSKGYIGFKINAITDKDIMDALIHASKEGVKVETIIRSIQCLKPGVKDMTENISINSIVGRFLEHSRVYIFGKKDPQIYVGSSDLMSRNLERRHEILSPVYDENVKNRLLKIFELSLSDTMHNAFIDEKGNHTMIDHPSKAFNVQDYFVKLAKSGKDYM